VKRRLALLFGLLATAGSACGGRNTGPVTPAPQTMNDAVTQFFAAVKANDLNRMGELWGTDRGAAVGFMDAQKLRERLTVIQKYLENSGYRIIEGPMLVPGHDELRSYRVELQRMNCNQVMPIDIVRTRSGGWLVYDVHLESAGSPGGPCQPATTGGGTKP
jgi:hypothetical protein